MLGHVNEYADRAEKNLERADGAEQQSRVVAYQVRAVVAALLAIASALDDCKRRIEELRGI